MKMAQFWTPLLFVLSALPAFASEQMEATALVAPAGTVYVKPAVGRLQSVRNLSTGGSEAVVLVMMRNCGNTWGPLSYTVVPAADGTNSIFVMGMEFISPSSLGPCTSGVQRPVLIVPLTNAASFDQVRVRFVGTSQG